MSIVACPDAKEQSAVRRTYRFSAHRLFILSFMPLYRRPILILLILLTGLASMIPHGIMPVVSDDGITFVICSGSELVKVRMLDNGEVVPDESPETGDTANPCSWGHYTSAVALLPPIDDIAGVAPAARAAYGIGAQDLTVRAKLSHYDSRGPPAFL